MGLPVIAACIAACLVIADAVDPLVNAACFVILLAAVAFRLLQRVLSLLAAVDLLVIAACFVIIGCSSLLVIAARLVITGYSGPSQWLLLRLLSLSVAVAFWLLCSVSQSCHYWLQWTFWLLQRVL